MSAGMCIKASEEQQVFVPPEERQDSILSSLIWHFNDAVRQYVAGQNYARLMNCGEN